MPAGILPRARGSIVGADARAVDEPELPVQPLVALEAGLELLEEPVEEPTTGRTTGQALVDSRSRAVALWQVAQRRAGVEDPEHAVENRRVIAVRPTARASRGHQGCEEGPLHVREVMAVVLRHGPARMQETAPPAPNALRHPLPETL